MYNANSIKRRQSTRFTYHALLLTALLLTLVPHLSFAKRVVEVTGTAAIFSDAHQAAKEQAIKNAMQQALLQTKAHIDTTSTISANVLLIDSARVNASGTVEDVKILDEWIEDGFYNVRIRAYIPNDNEVKKGKNRYRKKVAAIQFDILNRSQTHDLINIERELPKEILRRLENSGDFITIDATQYLISEDTPAFQFDNPGSYRSIANATDAQLIISGLIRDMRVEPGFFSDSRHLEIEVYLHDGISGARLARHRFSELIKNASFFETRQSLFSNASFYQTMLGKVLNRIIASQVEMLQNDLTQIPFSAKIVKINGTEVYFDAGASSLLRVGDVLMTYRLDADPLNNSNNQFLGFIETPAVTMTIEKIQPLFSKGKLEVKNSKLVAGDIIRFGR